MHNGFQVLDTSAASVRCAARYERHASLAYGVDWWRHPSALHASTPVVGSCSFYDRVFHLWRSALDTAA